MRQNQSFDRRYAQGRPGHHSTPRQARAISRSAVDISDVRQYVNLRHKVGPSTIKEDRWDDHHVRKSKQWSTRLRHKPFNTSNRQTQMHRTELVTSIRRIIGPDRCYYLCIPVYRRPQTALPANPFDCSTAALQSISDILNEMEWERNDRPRVVATGVRSVPRPDAPQPDVAAPRSPSPNLQPAAVMIAGPQASHNARPAAPTEGNPGSSPQGRPPRQQPGLRDAAATSAVSSPASPSTAPRSLNSNYQPVHGVIAQPPAFGRSKSPAPVGASSRPNQQQQHYRQQSGIFMEAGPSHNGFSAKKASKQPVREDSMATMAPVSPLSAYLKEEVDSKRLHKSRADLMMAAAEAAEREQDRMNGPIEAEGSHAAAGPSS